MIRLSNNLRLCGDWAPSQCSVDIQLDEHLILNIEGPIIPKDNISSLHPYPKAGPSLFNASFPDTTNPGIAILANNHLFDYSLPGYNHTLQVVRQRNWASVGAGLTRSSSKKPLVFEWGDIRVGVISRCETQFGVAQIDSPGVAEYSIDIYQQIIRLKKEVDFLIVSVHSASEMLPWPSPKRQDEFRFIVECGADLVHGHHSHVPNGWEIYENKYIFYGLGNLCVDPVKWDWHPNGLWSVSPLLTLANGCPKTKIETLEIDQNKNNGLCIRRSLTHEFDNHMHYLDACNKPLHNRELLESLWQEASLLLYDKYYSEWLGLNNKGPHDFVSQVKNKLVKASHLLRKEKRKEKEKYHALLCYHLFACDSHRDSISTALGLHGGEIQDLRTPDTQALIQKYLYLKS